jgi:hypothetical protein
MKPEALVIYIFYDDFDFWCLIPLSAIFLSNLWLGQKKYVAPASGKVYQLLAHGRWFSSVVLPQLKLVAMI